MVIGRAVLEGNHYRYRIRSPRAFIKGSFRTHDIGRAGHTKRIAGVLKRNHEWATQSILIHKSDYKNGLRVHVNKRTKKWYLGLKRGA